MNCKAILSNKAHPEYGQATVPFPIPDSEYDHTIALLEAMGIGSPTAQDCRVDGQAAALDLIQSGAGIVTPYGVVYDNGMKLEQVYDGGHFPEYFYEDCVASVALSRPGRDGRETLCLPCPDIKITRALQRLNAKDASQCTAVLDTDNICDAVRKVFEEEFKLNEHLDALNHLARCYQGFKGDDLEKFHTVFDHAWPRSTVRSSRTGWKSAPSCQNSWTSSVWASVRSTRRAASLGTGVMSRTRALDQKSKRSWGGISRPPRNRKCAENK